MKYAIVIPDGCADEPQESLGGKTPLQAAHKPNMDRIAQTGVVGRSNNVPPSLTPGQRRGHAEPVRLRPAGGLHRPGPARNRRHGHSPRPRATGRFAATSSTSKTRRCATSPPGTSPARTAGRSSKRVQQALGGPVRRDAWPRQRRLEFHPGVSYRNILVYRGDGPAPFATETQDAAAARHSRPAHRRPSAARAGQRAAAVA